MKTLTYRGRPEVTHPWPVLLRPRPRPCGSDALDPLENQELGTERILGSVMLVWCLPRTSALLVSQAILQLILGSVTTSRQLNHIISLIKLNSLNEIYALLL